MVIDFLLLLLSLVALAAGAEGLVRGSRSIALGLGMTPLMAGLTIVAFGTSAPELVVSLSAVLNGQAAIATGNVVGSNIFNIALILGITALIFPIKVHLNLLKQDAMIMVAATIVLALLLAFSGVPRWVGIVFLMALLAYNLFVIRMAKAEAQTQQLPESETTAPPGMSTGKALLFLAAGLVFLIGGSQLLVHSAVELARGFNVSEAVIGLTIVAAGTSMPELAASVTAALRKQPDIAIGNVIGSNIFNILGILGTCAAVEPVTSSGVSSFDLWVMTGFAVAALLLMYTRLSVQRHEGALLLTGYCVYMYLLWPA